MDSENLVPSPADEPFSASESAETVPPPSPQTEAQRTARLRDSRLTPPPADRERRGVPPLFWGLLFGCGPWLLILLFVLTSAGVLLSRGAGGRSSGGPRVGLLHLTGVITAGQGGSSPFSGSSAGSETLVEQLEKALRDDDIKAVVLRINSPGGSPVGSQEVYDEILRVKKKKPVIVSMGDMAASGGYYIASADRIFAGGGTMTASIGVIMEFPQVAGLLKKIGADMAVIKSGKFKDVGNPARSLTPEERSLLKALIMDVYGQFVTAVANGRHLPRASVLQIADGRVMSGSQALHYKLVDELGGLREAVAYAGKKGGISGEPKVQEIGGQGGLLQMLVGDSGSGSSSSADQSLQMIRLLMDPRVQEAVRQITKSSSPAVENSTWSQP